MTFIKRRVLVCLSRIRVYLSWPAWSWTFSCSTTVLKVHITGGKKIELPRNILQLIKKSSRHFITHFPPLHSVIQTKPGIPVIEIDGDPQHTRMDRQVPLAASSRKQDLRYKTVSDGTNRFLDLIDLYYTVISGFHSICYTSWTFA